jgi:microsomal epoxide hydrolase
MGFALFPKEINVPARSAVEQAVPNVIHWTEMPKGGHFAAMEQPAALVHDVRVFFAKVRATGTP